MSECKRLDTKSLQIEKNREICAGHKVFRRIDKYRFMPKRRRKKFRRMPISERKRDNEVRYGQSDSCTGDSGGPLWKWMGKN